MQAGDRVKVMIPLTETSASQAIRVFNGIETTIAHRFSRRHRSGGMLVTYYLDGCESERGVPFEFLHEWLIPLDEEGA